VDIGDGDLVRLARTGDAAACRVLVERHRAMALAVAGHVYALLADGSVVEIRPRTGRGIRSCEVALRCRAR
jgi:hypothetical protein